MSEYYPSERRQPSSAGYYEDRRDSFADPPHSQYEQHAPTDRYPASGHYQPDPYRHGPTEYASYEPSNAPQANEDNQLAPYDDAKGYAEYTRGYEQDRMYDRPPPPAQHDRRRDTRPAYDDRYDNRQSYTEPMRPPRDHMAPGPPIQPQDTETDRGLGATLIGGAGGAFLGNRMIGHGALGTLGGAVAGALSANAIESYEERHRREKDERRYQRRREDEGLRYDPRGDYRGSDYYGSGSYAGSTGPSGGAMNEGALRPARVPREVRVGRERVRRRRREDSESEDSYTSDD